MNRVKKIIVYMMIALMLMSRLPAPLALAQGEEADSGAVMLQDVNINITSYSIEPSTVVAGNRFKLSFTVQKDGSQTIKDGSVYVSFQTPEGISYAGNNQKMKLASFSNGQATTYSAEFDSAAEVSSGRKTIGMTFSYVFVDGNTQMQGSNEGMVHVSMQAAKAPKLAISGSDLKVDSGKMANLSFKFKNESSTTEMKNLDVEYSVSDGLTTVGGSSFKYGSIAAGASQNKNIKIQALKTAEQKQSITFTYSFDYTIGSQTLTATGEKTISIAVGKTENANVSQPYVILDKYNYGGTKSTGSSFTLLARFKNSSKISTLKDVVITLEAPDGLVLKDASNKIMIKSLAPGKSITKRIHLQVAQDASTGYKQVQFKINYSYASGSETKEAETSAVANISVQGKKDSLSPATPNLMISSYDYGDKVAAGAEFVLRMTVKNTSSSKGIENAVVSMEMPEDLAIAESSNTFYIKSLPAGGSYDYKLRLQALPTAKAMSSAITLNFAYEYVDDKERKQVTTTEQIAIPVYQPDRLSADLESQESEFYAGSEAVISIAYVNKGKGTLYNVEASIETDADVLEKKQNLGNFEAGANGNIEFYATPFEAGTLEGTVLIHYEDENMNDKTVKIPFSYDVMDTEDTEGMDEIIIEDEMGEEEESGKKSSGLLGIVLTVIGIVIVIIIIVVIILKIRKKKKLRIQQLEDMMDDEEDE